MDDKSKENTLNELIKEHWLYIQGLLQAHGVTEHTQSAVEFHYRTAFRHGWKHAMEEVCDDS